MSKWPTVKLEDIIGSKGLFSDGDWVESKDQDPNGEVRLIQLADIGDGGYLNKSVRFLTATKANDLRCTFIQPGDILIARMPDPLGRACIFPGDARLSVTVVDVCILRPDPRKADTRYVMHAINAPEFRNSIAGFISGTTRQRISRKNLGNLEIPLPPLDEQRRIAAILDKADALRQKRRQAIAKLDELAQAAFLEMFGDPVTNPMGWPKCTIGDLITEASYGSSGKAGADGQYPMLRMNNITYTGGWNFSDLKYIDYSPKEAAKYLLKKGDLLFNRTNSKELVGKTAVYRRDDVMSFAGYLIRVRANEKANTEFISAFLNSKSGKNLLFNMCKSIVGMANINAQELRSIPITQPPRKLQDDFAKIIAHLENEREKHAQASNMSDKFFTSLQSRAFSGDL